MTTYMPRDHRTFCHSHCLRKECHRHATQIPPALTDPKAVQFIHDPNIYWEDFSGDCPGFIALLYAEVKR